MRAHPAGPLHADVVSEHAAVARPGSHDLQSGEADQVPHPHRDVVAAVGRQRGLVVFDEAHKLRNVYKASMVAMQAGADFIKTSTGKVQPAATMPVTLVMLEAIRDFERATGRQVGMKPAGGIRTAKEAIQWLYLAYLAAVKEHIGLVDLLEAGAPASEIERAAEALPDQLVVVNEEHRLGHGPHLPARRSP